MQWGTVVWFADHPRPFLISEEYCSDPKCECNEVVLRLREISDRGIELSLAISFMVRVDLATWKECGPAERSTQTAAWVRQLLTEFPLDRRAEIRARIDEKKQIARRLAEFVIDPGDVMEGILFPYCDALSDRKGLSSGGRDYSYLLVYQDSEYMVDDLYCPNPTCDCREFHFQFWVRDRSGPPGKESLTIRPVFLGKVNFTGQRSVVERQGASVAEAEVLLSAWWDRYHDDLPMLKDRYQQVKEIGERSLAAARESGIIPPLKGPRNLLMPPTSLISTSLPFDPPSDRSRVGRNDPCPCGSGAKYKKCCGR